MHRPPPTRLLLAALVVTPLVSVNVSCGPPVVDEPDASTPRDAGQQQGSDAGSDRDGGPLEELVCTSNRFWTRGDNGAATMRPGHACIDCHDTHRGAPDFSVAGTVFPTVREPDDCNGLDGTDEDTVVEITENNGTVRNLPVNTVGNFFLERSLRFPLSVRVKTGTRVRAMEQLVTIGDCNSCHTQDGASNAPGRIHAP